MARHCEEASFADEAISLSACKPFLRLLLITVLGSRFSILPPFYRTSVLLVNESVRPLASTVLLHVQISAKLPYDLLKRVNGKRRWDAEH